MPYPAFPTDDQIQAFALNAGILLPVINYVPTFDFTGYGALAQTEFQSRTGRIPFLKDAVDMSRVYDPPGPSSKLETTYYKGGEKVLELDAGLLSCTSIYLGVTPDNTGTAMDLQRQLRLMPANSPAMGLPYEWVEFYFPVYGAPSSVVITGRFGYSAELPDDAYAACLRLGASIAATDILEGIFSTPGTFKEGDETTIQDSYDKLGQAWGRFSDRVIDRYKLIRLGV